MIKKFTSTSFVVNGSLILGVTIMLFGAWILVKIFGEDIPDNYYSGLFIIAFIFFIVGNIFIIKRKEIPLPGLPNIKGTIAVVLGYIQLVIFCLVELILIYYLFN